MQESQHITQEKYQYFLDCFHILNKNMENIKSINGGLFEKQKIMEKQIDQLEQTLTQKELLIDNLQQQIQKSEEEGKLLVDRIH